MAWDQHIVCLDTEELVWVKVATRASFERECKAWRHIFINQDAEAAKLLLPGIEVLRKALEAIDYALAKPRPWMDLG